MDIGFDFQPVQARLYEMYEYGRATKLGFGGSRGGSKSFSEDAIMLLRRFKYPGTNGLFVMRVYQDMVDIHITPLFDMFPGLDKYFNKQSMVLRLPNGSYIRFLSGDNLNTFRQRKGRAFADVMVDQSELFTQDEIEFLYTINRSTNINITPKTLLCFNPGNIGHTYHKRIFVDKIYEKNEKPEDFEFLQVFGWDNAYWSQKELLRDGLTMKDYHSWDSDKRFDYFIKTDYGRILDALPDNLRRAELLGDMNVFEGMFFADFRQEFHVIQNYEMRKDFSTIAGLDYGRVTVLEILQQDYEGTIVVCGEVYLNNLETPGERANAIADYLLEKQIHKLEIVYDTDMDISQISNVGFEKTPIEIFRQVFKQRMGENAPRMRVVNKTALDNKKGYRGSVNEAVKEYLHVREEGDKKRCSLYFSSECKHLIKCISELIHDTKDPNGLDFDTSMVPKTDHPFDGFKYGFMPLYKPRTPNPETRHAWQIRLEKKKQKQRAENRDKFMAK